MCLFRGGVCITVVDGQNHGCKNRTAEDFSDGEGQIWLDGLNCSGFESTIDECQHSNWGDTNCHHPEDAGCICEPPAENSGYYCEVNNCCLSKHCTCFEYLRFLQILKKSLEM